MIFFCIFLSLHKVEQVAFDKRCLHLVSLEIRLLENCNHFHQRLHLISNGCNPVYPAM